MEMFRVGGAVRDELLGLRSKDVDFACEVESFEKLVAEVEAMGGKVFLAKPEFLTVRALVQPFGAADFVMCRKDGPSSDNRRPDFVEAGTIMDDLARRDFTVNAMAVRVSTGEFLDPFNGREDLNNRVLRAVGNAEERFAEDGLRMLRAMRFSVTKGFTLESATANAMRVEFLRGVSADRMRDELDRMFACDTLASLAMLNRFPDLANVVFNSGVRLMPTMRK